MAGVGEDAERVFLAALATGVEEFIPAGSRVVVAVSGGPDSVALLTGWHLLARSRGDELHVAHFDHRLRDDSADDAESVALLAQDLALPRHFGHAETPLREAAGASLERIAREARYAFLSRTAKRLDARFVATGHTADDQAETVLHHIVRGTGLHGLRGIPPQRPLDAALHVIRPMLRIQRATILRFLAAIDRPARRDPSNDDRSFTRNRIRHELLPLLQERFNPRVVESLARLADIADRTSATIRALADRLLDESLVEATADEVQFDLGALGTAEPLLVAEVVRAWFERTGWPRRRLGHAELDRIVRLLDKNVPHACDLPDGFRATRTRTTLRIARKPTAPVDASAAPLIEPVDDDGR